MPARHAVPSSAAVAAGSSRYLVRHDETLSSSSDRASTSAASDAFSERQGDAAGARQGAAQAGVGGASAHHCARISRLPADWPGALRLRSALHTEDVVATTAATPRACLPTQICVLGASGAFNMSSMIFYGTFASLRCAARRGALPDYRHCPASAAVPGQQRQHDPHSAALYGQRGLCERIQRPRQQRRLRGILGGHRPTTDRFRSAGSQLLCCRRTSLMYSMSYSTNIRQHLLGIRPAMETLHTDP